MIEIPKPVKTIKRVNISALSIFKKTSPSSKFFILYIALFSALAPFATDTYSPAIPDIANYFQVMPDTVILTFATYFIGFSAGLFFWGPMSDNFGRKRILYTGVILYLISTIICAASEAFWQLAAARFMQGFSDAACVSVAFAVARDSFNKETLTRMIATIGMIVMIAPIIAPIIGVGIMESIGAWQYIFYFLTLLGLVLLFCSIKLPETLKQPHHHLLASFKQYIVHLSNYKFLLFAIASALSFSVFFTFIGASAVVYMKLYHTPRIEFALLFGFNATAVIAANLFLRTFSQRLSLHHIELGSSATSLSLCCFGLFNIYLFPSSVAIFVIFMWLITFSTAISTNSLMSEALNMLSHSFGAGTSLMNILKFGAAGVMSYAISLFDYQHINISLISMQALMALVTFSIVVLSILMLKVR